MTDKPATTRRAVAEAIVALSQETLSAVIDGRSAKGDVLAVAEVAGVMAGKRTSELIPLCHPLPLTNLLVSATPDRASGAIRIRAEAATTAPTGVEMEALTAASVAALTVYDMVKSLERGVEIRSVRLLSKSGGRTGDWERSSGPEHGEGPSTEEGASAERSAGARRSGRASGRIGPATPAPATPHRRVRPRAGPNP